MKLEPEASPAGGSSSTSQLLGISTLNTFTPSGGFSKIGMTVSKGARTGPLKLKPKRASMMRDVERAAVGKSEVNGMWRARSCVVRLVKS